MILMGNKKEEIIVEELKFMDLDGTTFSVRGLLNRILMRDRKKKRRYATG